MAEKFQNKYRVPSARLRDWDYRDDAMYFITICCKDRRHHFGKIEKGQMILTETGLLCEKYLLEIPEHFPFVWLDAAIVMPDHLHAIVVIGRGTGGDVGRDVACNVLDGDGACIGGDGACIGGDVACIGGDVACIGGDVACIGGDGACIGGDVACIGGDVACIGGDVACIGGDVACYVSTKQSMASISPKPGSLATILRSFKSAVKKDARFINPDFNWQFRFHDHVIRSPESHHRIKKYIENNPQNWDQDKFRES